MRAVGAALLALGALAATAAANHSVTEWVSTGPNGGNASGGGVDFRDASADGMRAFFETDEQLVTSDTDARTDVYQRFGGVTTRISAGESVSGNGDFPATFARASADGTRVFFHTTEALVTADNDSGFVDVYERFGSTTTLVSGRVQTDPGDDDRNATLRGASADGTRVFFETQEDLVEEDGDSSQDDVYERSGGTTTLVSDRIKDTFDGAAPADFAGASADGTRVFFTTDEQLVTADADSVDDVYERSSGTTKPVSTGNGGNGAYFGGASADGTRVFFATDEQLVGTDTDTATDVYERSGGTTTRVSAGQINGNGAYGVEFTGASADGTRVFFAADEQLVTADTDDQPDVYERSGGTTTLVSAGQINGNGEFEADFQGASTDGTRVFFHTHEQLVDEDDDCLAVDECYRDVYERSGGTTSLLSDRVQDDADADWDARFRGASFDGSRVFFVTDEGLVATDTDSGGQDLYERSGGATTLLSDRVQPGADEGPPNVNFGDASTDGTRVYFRTGEQILEADTDDADDIYLSRLADPAPAPAPGGGGGGGTGDSGSGGVLTGGPLPDLLGPTMAIAGGTIRAAATYVPVSLRCPADETVCTGTLTIDTARAIVAQRRRARKVRLGRASFKIAGGQKRVVRVRLSARNRKLLARRKRMRVVVTTTARDLIGNSKVTKRTRTVVAPRRRR